MPGLTKATGGRPSRIVKGGTREILETTSKEDYVLLRRGGGEKPLLLSDNMPGIKGILIVAGGVNSSLRLKVVRAIQRCSEFACS